MDANTVFVQLPLPENKVHTADWLKQQPPHIVADCLSACQSNHEAKLSVNMEHHIQQLEEKYQQEIRQLQYDHQLTEQKLGLELAEHDTSTMLKLNTQREDYETKLATLTDMIQSDKEDMKTKSKWYEEQIANNTREICASRDEYKTLVEKCEASISGLTSGGTKKGDIGQDFVIRTLRQMCLGTIENISNQAESADSRWEYVYPNTGSTMMCMVEVKFEDLNKKDGIRKLYRDIDRKLNAGEINCAIFFSLTATIANKQKLDMCIYRGIPVLFASREASDVIPGVTLVELAFRYMHQVFPFVTSEDNTTNTDFVARASESFLTYLHDIEANKNIISNLESNAHSMIEQAKVLRANLDKICSDISKLQFDFDLQRAVVKPTSNVPANALAASVDASSPVEADWSSDTGQEVIRHIIQAYKLKKGKGGYPKYNKISRLLRKETIVWLESMDPVTHNGEAGFRIGVNKSKQLIKQEKVNETNDHNVLLGNEPPRKRIKTK